MLKPSRSRTSLFSREKSVPSTTTASTSPESISNPTSTSVPKEVRRRSTFHNLFSPPFSSSSSGPPSPLNSPSPDLPSDPFRYSFRYTSGDFDRGRGRGRSQDEGDGHDHDHDQQRHHDDDTTSSIKHPGTSTTPKITLASPSTSTLNLVDDSSFRTRANLDPSTAHKIAKSLAKRQSPSQSHLSEIKQFQGPDSPEQPKLTPARPARRISHHASQPILSSASPPPARKDEKHPLSMRTLRRQPSMADLANARKHKEAGGEAMQRKASDATRGIGLGRQNEAWKSILSRRESEAWRELVDSRERDLKVPPVIDDDVSPMTKIFPAATTRSRSTTCTPQIAPAPAPAPSSKYHALSPTTSSDKHETHYMHRDGSVPILSPSLPQPDLGDPIDFSSPTHTYSHLDFSMSASSGMSRNGTVGSRLDSLPMSVAMERQPARRPAGSYPPYPVDPRELALRRLTAASGSASDIVSAKPKAVRRATSISVSKDKIEGKRVRAYSLSAKAAREVGLALSSNPIPTADKRQTSRGIYLGDLAIDLGGRYCDRSPSGTTETSLYPASTVSSPPPQSGRPLHPNLNKSEYSILAPSSIGLGFSPLGTPVSLPESLQAEAIDLTGNYAPRASDPVPPVPSQPVTPAPAPAAQSTSAPGTQGTMDPKEKPSLRRSFLLAQNTFYIPPISAPPSLRSSRSMSNIHSPVTPHVSPPVPSIPPSASAYTKRRRGTGAFICSPTDSIDPLPLPQNATSPSEAGGVSLERKRSKPFLTASNSIRMMFNPIARSLSKSFDREVKADTHNTSALESSTSGLKGKISSPINKEDEREWRAGLLKEALTASLSGTPEQEKRNGNPQSRLAIPQQLLDAPVLHEPITTNDEAGSMAEDPTQMDVEEQQQDEVRRREKRQSTNTQGAPRGLEVEAVSDIASQASSYAPTIDRASSHKTTRHKRAPTPPFPRLGSTTRPAEIPPPLPTQGDLSRLGLDISFDPPTTSHLEVATEPKSTDSNIAALPTETASVSVARSIRSFSLRPKPKKSSPRMTLAAPVSSTSPPPAQPLLEALASRDRVLGWRKDIGPDEDTRKVLAWRDEVEENGEMARFEESIVRHVQREKEAIREMRKRDGSLADHGLGDDDYREPVDGDPADDSFRVDMANEEIQLEFGIAE